MSRTTAQHEQTSLIDTADIRPDSTPSLAEYDVILVASSAGKDSQAMLDYVAELARAAGVEDRIVVLHNDLGEVEWPGTAELAQEQAKHYGFRFEMRHREQGLLLDQIRDRHSKLRAKGDTTTPAWPSSAARYCTSDQKRGPARKLITQLVGEKNLDRQARVLYCLGLRAQESSGRAKKPELAVDPSASSGVREVTVWHPILHWSEDDVWARIRTSGVRYHWAYDKGMKRLSCSFCVLASREDLLCAARLRPDMAAKYAALEDELGHTFKADLSMADIVAAAATH
ncbi:phosphoadenosine phosphosulfate reductase family protein [Streptomyces sp. NPDC047515]|uniref:phosphoadenosine phosphosulfate reductase family protein n=1 Tax=Streptomyces sp. NPDC047515 TaxID=3155380 RepID=UPI0033F20C97